MQERYYLEVDVCPVRAWRKAHENDFTYLRKNKDVGTEEEDKAAWYSLYDDYLRVFGHGVIFQRYLDLIRDKIMAQSNYILSLENGYRDEFLLNEINDVQNELDELISQMSTGNGDIPTTLLHLSKTQGYHLNEKEITVLEYFNLIKLEQNGRK
jgi:hypothetical protein